MYPRHWRGPLHMVGTLDFREERIADVRDGLSNTLMVGESTTGERVCNSGPCGPVFVRVLQSVFDDPQGADVVRYNDRCRCAGATDGVSPLPAAAGVVGTPVGSTSCSATDQCGRSRQKSTSNCLPAWERSAVTNRDRCRGEATPAISNLDGRRPVPRRGLPANGWTSQPGYAPILVGRPT